MSLLLGAIADDFTGATDLANTLVNQGMRATLVIGVPDEATQIGDAEAVIVALKSRTEAVEAAVSDSVKALQWLQGRGAEQFFFKYCSTFDSTADGNIGPVADALMDVLEADFAFVCPAFPANGRSVYQGYLFVNEVLLSESSMKDHPLTPMRDASLPRLMNAQSWRHCGLITLQRVITVLVPSPRSANACGPISGWEFSIVKLSRIRSSPWILTTAGPMLSLFSCQSQRSWE